MKLIDGVPQHIRIRHARAGDGGAGRLTGFEPHPGCQRQRRASRGKYGIKRHQLRRTGLQGDPDDAAPWTATPFARRHLGSTLVRHVAHLPARTWAGYQPRQSNNPGRDEVERSKFKPRQHPCLGTRTSHRDHLNSAARAIRGFRQIEKKLTALDPKQMTSSAFGAAFDRADGEDVDVPSGHLQHVPAVVEKLWTTAIEHNAGRRIDRVVLIGHRRRPLKDRFVHS